MAQDSVPNYEFMDVAATSEIPAGEGRAFEVAERMVAIYNCDGQFFAIDDLCPHMGASLAAGHMENCIVACPWHAWRFDVRDGTWVDNPRIKTDAFPIRIVQDRIQVGMPRKMVSSKTASTSGSTIMPSAQNAPRTGSELTLGDFQALIRNMYYDKDRARGIEGTFMWLMEEVGELSSALRERDRENQIEEFADVLAWLCTIANVCDIDLTEAIQRKYGTGCPGCKKLACICPDSEKP
jgi:nitrite reductase/ring-hydroxylating ferredoxin subunit/NTP pyrophosphatase (non-canonical NTP hydrolase)